MIRTVNDNLTGTEKTCSERFTRHGYVDIHCHCLPAVDDGPATTHEALALCHALVGDGITDVLGRFATEITEEEAFLGLI